MTRKKVKHDVLSDLIGVDVFDEPTLLTEKELESRRLKKKLERENPSPSRIFDNAEVDGSPIDLESEVENLSLAVAEKNAEMMGVSVGEMIEKIDEAQAYKISKRISLDSFRSNMGKDTLTRLLEGYAYGFNNNELSAYCGVSKDAISIWESTYPKLAEYRESMGKITGAKAKMNVAGCIASGDTEMSKWFLERTDEDFATKTKSEVVGKNGGPIQMISVNINP